MLKLPVCCFVGPSAPLMLLELTGDLTWDKLASRAAHL